MRILIIVSKAVLGGHVISSFTIAKHLKKRGHSVFFAGGRAKLSEEIEKKLPFTDLNIPFFHGGNTYDNGGREAYFTWKSFNIIPQIRQIILNNDIDIIHAFDARAYVHASIAALLEKKPITCTLCGGIDPLYNLPLTSQIIVFSEEQRRKMLETFSWSPNQVKVIRTRVDIKKIVKTHQPTPIKLPIKDNVSVLMMISSFDGTKEDSIRQVINSLELLLKKENINFQMIFIGGKGVFWQEIKQYCDKLNKQYRKDIFIFTGPVIDAYKLLKNASIVLGVGRSAFEGMAYKKPTIIVGENGFAGIVSPETVQQIGFYNFSGRNQKKLATPRKLVTALKLLISNASLRTECGQFCYNFVNEEINVENGISRIEVVYDKNIKDVSSKHRCLQWISLFKIMIPIWRDNWWHTVGVPLKKFLGIKISIPTGDLEVK